jgi:16S rRNA (cytosine967-C5)-methyltransferase
VHAGGEALADLLAGQAALVDDPRERGFLHELVLGTLRLRGLLDHAIAPLLDRPLAKVDPLVMDVLRLGAHEMLHLRVPDRAAVSQAVELAKQAAPRAAGFVNAVLRRLARVGPPATVDPASDPLGWLTTAGSLPAWIASRWAQALGPAGAVARARALLAPAPRTVRLNPRVKDAAQRCLDAGGELQPLGVPGALLAGKGRITALAEAGVLYAQDLGSQLVAHLAARNGLLLDACAAPGGKALLLADLGGGAARVVAAEASARRLATMASLAARWASPGLLMVRADALRPPFGSVFDAVLLDAPCSGLGTLGRNPDIKWRLEPAELARQAARQSRLLASVARLVRPGGRLVYAVCSLEEEETLGVARPFLSSRPDFQVTTGPDWARPFRGADGFYRTRPEDAPADGFFAALFARP